MGNVLEVKKNTCFDIRREALGVVSSCLWRFTNKVDEELLEFV